MKTYKGIKITAPDSFQYRDVDAGTIMPIIYIRLKSSIPTIQKIGEIDSSMSFFVPEEVGEAIITSFDQETYLLTLNITFKNDEIWPSCSLYFSGQLMMEQLAVREKNEYTGPSVLDQHLEQKISAFVR